MDKRGSCWECDGCVQNTFELDTIEGRGILHLCSGVAIENPRKQKYRTDSHTFNIPT